MLHLQLTKRDKVILVTTASVFLLLGWISARFVHRQELRQIVANEHGIFAADESNRKSSFLKERAEAARAVHFISAMPPIAGIGRALANKDYDGLERTPLALWKQRLQAIFTAYVQSHPGVLQARLIGVESDGREMVCLQRESSGKIAVVADSQLKSKGDHPYFTKAMLQPAGEIYLSPIELKQEYGKIVQPLTAVTRAALALRNGRGEVFGVLVVDMDAQPLFEQLAKPAARDAARYITDSAGHFLWHPQPGRAFGHETGASAGTWQQEFHIVSSDFALPGATTVRSADGTEYFERSSVLMDANADGSGGLVVHSVVPVELARARAWRAKGWAIALILLELFGMGALLV